MAATYFDHNATTAIDPGVSRRMAPWLEDRFGNPSSIHGFGQRARDAVETAREEVAALLGAGAPELVFLSSGTEANNAVLRSVMADAPSGAHLVVSEAEHASVAVPAESLAAAGAEVSWVAPDSRGRVDPDAVRAAVRDDTRLVALVLANSVVGTIQPVAEVAEICRGRGVPVLCDAVQAVGKMTVHVGDLGVDYLSLGAHKFYGPLGAAALWIRPRARFAALLEGGAQERRRRAGTQNVPAIVGFGEAARIAADEMESRGRRLLELRQRFEDGLGALPDTTIHGSGAERLPNTTHVAFAGVDNHALLIRLDLAGFAVSAGSACSSGTLEPARILPAMGISADEARSAIRVSFGKDNTRAEVERFLGVLEREVSQLRRLAGAST